MSLHAVAPPRLHELARVINTEHEAVSRAGREMIEHAIRCGEALLAAREEVPNGEWLDWVKGEHVSVHIWTAHRYMRLATHADEVRASDARYIEDAMRLLADKPRLGYGPRALSAHDRREIADHYHEYGMAATIEAWGVAKSTVWRLVSDKSPAKLDPDAPVRPREVTDDAVERLAMWLVERFGGDDYPIRVTPEVREDATSALIAAHTAPDLRELPREQQIERAKELWAGGATCADIAARCGASPQTVLRWVDPDQAERSRARSLDWKNKHRQQNRAADRKAQADKRAGDARLDAAPINVSPFDRLMWERNA